MNDTRMLPEINILTRFDVSCEAQRKIGTWCQKCSSWLQLYGAGWSACDEDQNFLNAPRGLDWPVENLQLTRLFGVRV